MPILAVAEFRRQSGFVVECKQRRRHDVESKGVRGTRRGRRSRQGRSSGRIKRGTKAKQDEKDRGPGEAARQNTRSAYESATRPERSTKASFGVGEKRRALVEIDKSCACSPTADDGRGNSQGVSLFRLRGLEKASSEKTLAAGTTAHGKLAVQEEEAEKGRHLRRRGGKRTRSEVPHTQHNKVPQERLQDCAHTSRGTQKGRELKFRNTTATAAATASATPRYRDRRSDASGRKFGERPAPAVRHSPPVARTPTRLPFPPRGRSDKRAKSSRKMMDTSTQIKKAP